MSTGEVVASAFQNLGLVLGGVVLGVLGLVGILVGVDAGWRWLRRGANGGGSEVPGPSLSHGGGWSLGGMREDFDGADVWEASAEDQAGDGDWK